MTYEQLYEYYSTLRDKRVLTAKLCCEEARFDAEARVEMVDMVLDAIDKQIAKKPVKLESWLSWTLWGCPSCGCMVDHDMTHTDHHCQCGQHLDWSDKE